MISVDLHSHSIFSQCGIHTHLELLTYAKNKGMKALAITDHGPLLDPKIPPPFYDRFQNPIAGIELLKGMECNLSDTIGVIDLPKKILPYIDVVLLGIHPNTPLQLGRAKYTELVSAAIKANPEIDILSHPNDIDYPIDVSAIAGLCKEYGIAMELNNSRTLYQRNPDSLTLELITVCKNIGCSMVITSDAHALLEVGDDSAVMPLLHQAQFPEDLVITSSAEKAFAFLRQRKKNKRF